MNDKLMAEIFNDAIAASRVPTMAGAAGRSHRGCIAINDELISALLHAQAKLVCDQVQFGEFKCYSPTKYGSDVDMCLVAEINMLNSRGIKTIGCCCGHNKHFGYIQVAPGDCDKMIALGYVQRPVKDEYCGRWCFGPKTILPDPDAKWKSILGEKEEPHE